MVTFSSSSSLKLIMPCLQFPRIQALVCCYLLWLLIILQSTQTTAADYDFVYIHCPADANYTANSTYQSNLNLLLSNLSTAAVATGYYNGTAGSGANQVYGLAQCRGDESSADCRSCLSTATQNIVKKCPKAQNSAIFYEECFLRYANQSFFSSTNTPGYDIFLCNAYNNSNPQVFDNLLGTMMDDLSTRASNSPKKYAGGVTNYTSFTELYGLAQCTRDLSQPDCYRCIQDLRGKIPRYCGQRNGGRIFAFTCYVRYEVYQFYNISADALPPPPPPPPPLLPSSPTINGAPQGMTGEKKNSNTWKVLAIVIPIAVAVIVLLLISLFLYRRRMKSRGGQGRDKEPNFSSTEYILFNFATLRSATNNFADSNKLGEGGFGPVYKGTLESGEQIAVKRLSINSGQGLVEFKTEIVLVAKLQHKNLVRLLGCCFQGQEKILVYEYLPNKSLDKILFDSSRRVELNWGRRRKIIEGIARGLLYLHEDSRLKIIHRDLKASNILLDRDMNSKISDFGLAKLVNIDETQRNTSRIAGTYGYMAPEYAMHGLFSVKSDVFSYGVLVLEIVTGRRNNVSDGYSTNLLSYVWQHWNEGRALEVVDQSIVNHLKAEEAIRCIHIGLLCVQEDAADRPNMTSVVLMLSSYSVNLPNPYAPAFVFHSRSTYDSDSLDLSDAQGKKRSSKGSTMISQDISEDDPIILSA